MFTPKLELIIGFILIFSPSISGVFLCSSMRQWARREAEHLIQQREADGGPLIEENYYDTNKIILPTTGGQ